MNIPLFYVLQYQYPAAALGPGGNVQLSDHGDGNGPIIQSWSVPNEVQPTVEQLTAWQTDTNTMAYWKGIQNGWANIPILAQLQELDTKSVRSLRESDPTYLATLTSQAVALRAQLLPTTVAAVLAAGG